MKKRMAVVLMLLVVLFGAVFGWKAFMSYKMHAFMASRGMPVISVSTAPVKVVRWQQRIHSVGTLLATQGVTLTAQLPGAITALHFHSGQRVRAGQLLMQINDGPQLAQLQYDIAQTGLAATNLRRTRTLYRGKAASQAQLDSAVATYNSAKAHVAGDRATINELALRAPFAGVLGIRQVNLGQYLAPGSAIVDLQSDADLYVNFTVPQQDVPRVHIGQPIILRVDSYPHRAFMGRVHAIDATVNPATRNLLVQAEVPNRQDALRPGMFATVRIVERKAKTVLTVPAVALTYNTYGDTVYVVRSAVVKGQHALIAHQVLVTTGNERHGQVIIKSGLKAGWSVVTAGQVKLHNGMPVSVNNRIRP